MLATLYGLTRRLAGEDIADSLQVPDTAFKYVGAVLRPRVQLAEVGRRLGLRGSHAGLAKKACNKALMALEAGRAPATVGINAAVAAMANA